jgi:hypothetical protein
MTTTTSITPISQIGKTVLGTIRELYAYSGLPPVYDTSATLNAKYSVAQTLTPTALPSIGYFGIGIGGCFNVDTGMLSQPYPVLGTNMDLYTPIPFRCVPVEQDLTTLERAQYRLRVQKTIGSAAYYLYYLKVITYNQTTVQLTETDPVTASQSPYVLDYTNLNPTHPSVGTGGTITSVATEVNASVTSTLLLTGAEVTEVVNVLYGGDLRYAKISEIGLYSGQDQTIAGTTSTGAVLNYTEAVLAQLNMAYNWLGDDYSNPARSSSYQIVQGSGQLLII